MSGSAKKIRSRDKKEIYVAFSGGGAKAFIHVGALNFLEKNYRIRGVSGTSAGALIAVLKAAGFTSADMFVPNGDEGKSIIFDKINSQDKTIKNISYLLGGDGLKGLVSAKNNPIIYFIKRTSFLQKFVLLISFLMCAFAMPFLINYAVGLESKIANSIFTLILMTIGIYFWVRYSLWPVALHVADHIVENGISCTNKAIDEIEKQVAARMGISGRAVVMGDFKIPIRIIAANLDRQEAKIFSNTGTPTTSLRDALSASICIPVAFKPHLYDGDRYIDGGVVSNVPAFVFSEEICLYPKRRIIALRITETGDDQEKSDVLNKLARFFIKRMLGIENDGGKYSSVAFNNIVHTLFRGAQDLAHVDMDVVAADLPTTLRLLDFDIGYKAMGTAYKQGQVFANKLITQSFDAENEHHKACRTIFDYATKILQKIPLTKRRNGEFVRVAVAYVPFEGSSIIKIKYGYGFDRSSDRDVVLPLDESVCGKAWTSRKLVFEPRLSHIRADASPYTHISSRIDRDIQWILSVPILDKNGLKTRFVINIDSNSKIVDTLKSNPEALDNIKIILGNLAKFSTLIGNGMRDALDSLEEKV